MQYIVEPIAGLIKWSFDNILEPIGNLPGIMNPNTIFIVIISIGLAYWMFQQQKFNKKAAEEGGLK